MKWYNVASRLIAHVGLNLNVIVKTSRFTAGPAPRTAAGPAAGARRARRLLPPPGSRRGRLRRRRHRRTCLLFDTKTLYQTLDYLTCAYYVSTNLFHVATSIVARISESLHEIIVFRDMASC